MTPLDKLGYYECDGKIFRSKMQALIYANPENKTVHWRFNDTIFDSCDWTIEPVETLQQLYFRRARELREQYDYIIISFSGGSDSHNVVESFLQQGLHIDEIISTWSFDISESFLDLSKNNRLASNNNAEFKLNAVDRLESIRLRSPRTKITCHDTSKSVLNSLMMKDDPTWIEDRNDVVNVTGVINYNMLYHSELRKTLDKDIKIGFVVGTDKPRLKIKDNNLFLFFQDKAVNMITINENLIDYTNTTVELFYWDPSCLDMLKKQAHVMRKILTVYPNLKQIWQPSNFVAQRTLGEEIMKKYLYDNWNPEWFQVAKTTGDWFGEIDYWFTVGMRGSEEYERWMNGLKYITPKISNFLMYDHGKIRGTQFFFSKDHYVGTV